MFIEMHKFKIIDVTFINLKSSVNLNVVCIITKIITFRILI